MKYSARHRYLGLLLLGSGWVEPGYADETPFFTSRSFLFERPLNQNIAARNFFWQDIEAELEYNGIRVLPLYQHTRCNLRLAGYFLLNCQSSITIAGNDSGAALTRDVCAEYLRLPSTFNGILSLTPYERQTGTLVTYNHNLGHIIKWLERVWFTVSFPIISCKRALNPSQRILTNPGPINDNAPSDLLSAFNQPSFRYGRMTTHVLSKAGLSEINIGFGTTFAAKNDFLLWYQTTLDIQTFKRADPTFLFSPVVGPNGHFAWSNEVAIGFPLQPEDSCYHVRLIMNLASHFYFPKNQIRVFDLHHKPWSRYLLLRNQRDRSLVVPAISVLSQCVRVHPHCAGELAISLAGAYEGYTIEAGYFLWARNQERLTFLRQGCSPTRPLVTDFGIADITPESTCSASNSTIFQPGTPDTTFVTLFQNDINLHSGATPGALSQGVHIELGYRGTCAYAALGSWIEQPHTNTALKTWGVFGTIGTEF